MSCFSRSAICLSRSGAAAESPRPGAAARTVRARARNVVDTTRPSGMVAVMALQTGKEERVAELRPGERRPYGEPRLPGLTPDEGGFPRADEHTSDSGAPFGARA